MNLDPIRFTEINRTELPPNVLELVASQPGRLLRFKNAVLARSEVNANKDEISQEGIQELAATLPLTAIDIEHGQHNIVGYYTDARAVQGNNELLLDVDGIIFADRFPAEAEGVRNGTYLQSIEADVKTAECSVCASQFTKRSDYCAHIRSKTAVRKLRGLTAKGGAITRRPAGTNTKFDPSKITLIASLEDEQAFEGAKRAAHRFMACLDVLQANPGAHYNLASPVLSPFMFDPNQTWIEAQVARIVNRSLEAQATTAKALVSDTKQELTAANQNVLSQVERLKLELNARIDALTKENQELKAALAPKETSKEEKIGVVGFSWIRDESASGEDEKGKEKLTWGNLK